MSTNNGEDLINQVMELEAGKTPTTPEKATQRRSPMDPSLTPSPLKFKGSPSATNRSPTVPNEPKPRGPARPSRHRRAAVTYGGEVTPGSTSHGHGSHSDSPRDSRNPFEIATQIEPPSSPTGAQGRRYVSAGPGPATVEARQQVEWKYPAPSPGNQSNRVTLEDLNNVALQSVGGQTGHDDKGTSGNSKYKELKEKVRKGVDKVLKR